MAAMNQRSIPSSNLAGKIFRTIKTSESGQLLRQQPKPAFDVAAGADELLL